MSDRRKIGRTGMTTYPFVLGGNVFGWTAKGEVGFDILDRFVDSGGTMIDTADFYSAWAPGHIGGESEDFIGRWLKRRNKRDDVYIASKVGMLSGPSGSGLKPERIAEAIDASLERLQTDYLDLYYAHRDNPDVPMDEVLSAFADLVSIGKVRAIGASNYTAERLAKSLELSAKRNWPAFEVLQPELNILKREAFSQDLRKLCAQHGLGALSYFSLASGYLTGKYRSTDDFGKSPRGDQMGYFHNSNGPKVLAVMDEISDETGATPAQIALAWSASQPGITAPIASATSLDQLEELVGSLNLVLSDDHVTHLDAAANSRPERN